DSGSISHGNDYKRFHSGGHIILRENILEDTKNSKEFYNPNH
ncbi:unnamed protein product, partial [marine sediment metagenome]